MCVSDNEVDIVVVILIACVRDPVIRLCMYACGEVKSYWCVDELFEVEMF
jgi:hypothetical protein